MSAAERLRAAAEKIRETDYWAEWQDPWWTPDGLAGLEMAEPDAKHVALWSPPVALAVADWLDNEALVVADLEVGTSSTAGWVAVGPAFALADLILGGES